MEVLPGVLFIALRAFGGRGLPRVVEARPRTRSSRVGLSVPACLRKMTPHATLIAYRGFAHFLADVLLVTGLSAGVADDFLFVRLGLISSFSVRIAVADILEEGQLAVQLLVEDHGLGQVRVRDHPQPFERGPSHMTVPLQMLGELPEHEVMVHLVDHGHGFQFLKNLLPGGHHFFEFTQHRLGVLGAGCPGLKLR